jgi:uncharacterized protein
MLIEFTVGNYRSFKDPVTLNMAAARLVAKDKTLDENNVFEASGAPPLLSTAAVYGANASGKSNLIAAISFMRHFVLDSTKKTQPTGDIGVEHFRLSTDTLHAPSHFEIIFVLDGKRYRYGFEVTSDQVLSEWLYYVPSIREARLFTREANKVTLSDVFKEGRDIIDKTRPNALFLSVVAQFNGPLAQKVLRWFRHLNVISGLYDEALRPYTLSCLLDGKYKEDIVRLVQKLDLGIGGMELTQAPISLNADTLPTEMPENIKKWFLSMPTENSEALTVKTTHPVYDANGQTVRSELFDLDENESEGTKKLFSLAGPLVDTLRAGKILVIDELDARLHPTITSAIIGLFNSKDANPCHAQLIFTTQDTNLLDNKLFRRDQIWFTEKDRQGATHLYSLAEFRMRNDASFERDYVRGRYGAVPFIGDLKRMFGEPCDD